MNVLCLSGDTLLSPAMGDIVDTWLDTPFDGGRHQRRIEKIGAIEQQWLQGFRKCRSS